MLRSYFALAMLAFSFFSAVGAYANTPRSLVFKPEHPGNMDRMHVFVDKTAPNPRCRCTRFTVLVDDRRDFRPGATVVSEVQIRAIRDGKVIRKEVLPVSALNRNPKSPVLTGQFMLVGPEKGVKFEVSALKYRCMNLGAPGCRKKIKALTGKFEAKQVLQLVPSTAYDVLYAE